MPQISVIVPVYNVEKYLHRCIDSILAQTFTDFELILVDDGSPDNCGAICDEYATKDSRVRVIHKENGGVSRARNAALDVSRGDYIAICDSDDYWDKHYLEKMLKAAIENSVDFVVTNYRVVDEEGQRIYDSDHKTGIVNYENEEDKFYYLINYLMHGAHGWSVCTRLFKAEIIQKNELRFCEECNNYAEDMGFSMEYALCSKKAYSISEPLYYYVMRADSMMHSSTNTIKLNQLNEVSYHVAKRYHRRITLPQLKKRYAVLHFLMMNTEMQKIIGTEKYSDLGIELNKIEKLDWCKKQYRKLRANRGFLEKYYGKRITQQIGLFTHYCFHNNWRRFCYESAFAYRWLIAKE